MHLPNNKKSLCDPNALKADYMEIAGQLDNLANVIIYTDGSVNAEGKCGAGIYAVTKSIPTTQQHLAFMVSNKASNLQTEILAINQALRCVNTISWHGSHHTMVLHTESLSLHFKLSSSQTPETTYISSPIHKIKCISMLTKEVFLC